MNHSTWTKAAVRVAGFGTAMAAAAHAQYAEGDIVLLSFSPNPIGWQGSGLTSAKTQVKAKVAGNTIFSFNARNFATNTSFFKSFSQGVTPIVSKPVKWHALALSPGAPISGAMTFTDRISNRSGVTEIRAFNRDLGAGDNYYGWIKVQWGNGRNTPISILQGFYNDTINGSINAGDTGPNVAVPEPSSVAALSGLGLLALGAAGIAKRRTAADAQGR